MFEVEVKGGGIFFGFEGLDGMLVVATECALLIDREAMVAMVKLSWEGHIRVCLFSIKVNN